jgi:CheY-like chemotaxis protein
MFDRTVPPRVLVVDDESIIADTLVLILNKSGYEATAAYSGEQALELAPMIEPDVLISDVAMKGIDGIETAIRITGELPECRVVLFSGQAHTADLLHEATAKGYAFEVLRKPVAPAALLNHVHSLLGSSGVKAAPGPQSEERSLISLARDN